MKTLFYAICVLVTGLMATLPMFAEGTGLYAIEAAAALIFAGMIVLYRMVISPTKTLERGIDLLKAQDFTSRLMHIGYGPADKIADTFNEMMEQLKNERLRVREQNHFLDLLAEASPMGIVIFDYEKRIQSINPAAARMLGGKDVKGKRMQDIDNELAAALAKLPDHSTKTIRLCDNSTVKCSNLFFFDHGHQRRFMLVASLTEELLEAERAAYGKVIRTMVHQVNNTLAGVLPLIDTFAAISGDETAIAAAKSCTDRCTSLSEFIGNFATVVKIGEPQLQAVNINEFIGNLRAFLESLASDRDIKMVFYPDGEMDEYPIDTVQFEQVIVNIVKNSVESIGDKSGVIEISTDSKHHTLTVTDNGAGISDEAAGKLFTPFFSTKKSGQGIGLTLSAEILRAHNFDFNLSTSRTDGKTRFTINLRQDIN